MLFPKQNIYSTPAFKPIVNNSKIHQPKTQLQTIDPIKYWNKTQAFPAHPASKINTCVQIGWASSEKKNSAGKHLKCNKI